MTLATRCRSLCFLLACAVGAAVPRPAIASDGASPSEVDALVADGEAAQTRGDHLAAIAAYREARDEVRTGDEHRELRVALALRIARAAKQQYAIDRGHASIGEAIGVLEHARSEAQASELPAVDANLERLRKIALASDASQPWIEPKLPPVPAHLADRGPIGEDVRVRATLAEDRDLRRQWRRGSALVGLSVPTMAAGAGLFVSGIIVPWIDAPFFFKSGSELESDLARGAGLIMGGVAVAGVGAGLLAFGIRERKAVRRAASERFAYSLTPGRDGASLGLRMRF